MPTSRRQPARKQPAKTPKPKAPNLLRLDACQKRNLDWLWDQRIPLGKVTLLVGDPDSGKSFVALDLAARVSRGLGIPPEPGLQKPGQVLLLSADDDVEDTILPRLEAAGADLARISILTSTPRSSRTQAPALLFLARDLHQLEHALEKLPRCRLIVIDPINAYLRGLAGHNDIAIRQILQKLTRLARERNAAILMTAHQRKQVASTAIHRPLGSVAFAAVARVVLLLAQDPHIAGRRLIVPAKMTLHAAPTGRAFHLADTRVHWEPEVVPLTADELRIVLDDADDEPRRAAKEWLISQLEKQSLPANEIKRRAAEQRIPWRALWAARKLCHVISFRDPHDQRYYWKLPRLWMRNPISDMAVYL